MSRDYEKRELEQALQRLTGPVLAELTGEQFEMLFAAVHREAQQRFNQLVKLRERLRSIAQVLPENVSADDSPAHVDQWEPR